MDEVVKALDTLYSATNRDQRHAADKWLREWQKSSETWQVATAMLSDTNQAEEVSCFAAQTLRSKIMYDFVELPAHVHETLCGSLLGFVTKFHESQRVLTMLSLALADLSLQTARSWASPVRTLLARFGDQQLDQWMIKALLLMFKHLPEENHNRRVMADHSAREAHRLVLQKDKEVVFGFLTEIVRPRAETAGGLMAGALDCWKSWISNVDVSPTDVYKSPFFHDCFKIVLCSTTHLSTPQPLGDDSSDRCLLEDSARECLSAVLRRLNSVAWSQGGCDGTDLSREAIVNECLNQFAGAHATMFVDSALQADDVEALSVLTDLCVQVAVVHVHRFITELQTDHRLQAILTMLMKVATACTYSLAAGVRGDVGGLWFWSRLSDEICAYRNKQNDETRTAPAAEERGGGGVGAVDNHEQQGVCDSNVAALVGLYERLAEVALSHCVATCEELSSDGYIGDDFTEYRKGMIDCVRDCCEVLGPVAVANKVLDKFASADASLETYKFVREASLFILAQVIREVRGEPAAMPKMFLLVDNCADLLKLAPPEDALEITCRVTSVHLMADSILWMRDRPAALSRVVNQLIGQAVFAADRCDRLRVESIRAFKDICVALGPSLHDMLDALCNVAREGRCSGEGVGTAHEVQFCLLEGISIVASSLPDDSMFLHVLESLCKPLIAELKANASDASHVAMTLDCLAIILKDVIPGVRRCKSRGDLMCAFVLSTLWPLLEALLSQFAANSDRVAERCIRCLKHSVRCIEHRVQPLVPEIVRVVVSCAAAELHSCYLYCAEYMAKELQNVPEVQPLLNDLFNDLSNRALSVLEQHRDRLNDYPLLVEDCFGMFIRYLNFCPHIATKSPHLPRALKLCEEGIYQDRKDSVSTVFVFLDNIVRGKLTSHCELPVADITPVIHQSLPPLVRQLFKLLLAAPPNDVLDHIDMVIESVVQVFPEHAQLMLEAGMAELPMAVLPTPEMKADTLKKIMKGPPSLHGAIDEIAYRCQQYVLRCGRS
eukprot:GHVS01027393.1.p1 GENE.GHVS01027393.1~~GHVS01027393.1.p1  ORF type:complete len:1007 (-),score=187.88 GHVS01027393.1:293-3313(-)